MERRQGRPSISPNGKLIKMILFARPSGRCTRARSAACLTACMRLRSVAPRYAHIANATSHTRKRYSKFICYNKFMKKIFIGGDHAGFKLKEKLKEYLKNLNYKVYDMGAFSYDPNDDYPDFILPVTKEVVENQDSFGIILGGSGQGEQIVANKRDGIRAIEYYGGNLDIVRLGREHNDANILSIGARFVEENEAKEAAKLFLETPFSKEERHERRIQKIKEIEITN